MPVPEQASMKVPPKRKGNLNTNEFDQICEARLNESPSEKEGKSSVHFETLPNTLEPQ